MRKKLIFTIAALLMGATMFAQEQTQVQVQNQRQEKQIMKRNRVNVQNQEAVKSGDPIMQRNQKRIQKKDGTCDGTGNSIQQRDRDRVNFQKQARPMNRMTRPPMQGAQKRGGR